MPQFAYGGCACTNAGIPRCVDGSARPQALPSSILDYGQVSVARGSGLSLRDCTTSGGLWHFWEYFLSNSPVTRLNAFVVQPVHVCYTDLVLFFSERTQAAENIS